MSSSTALPSRRGSPDPHQLLLTSWHRSGALPWAWLLVESALCPSLWPKLCGSSFVDQDRHTDQAPLSSAECAHIFGLETPGSETTHQDPVWARFLLVTVNVQSLSDGDKAPVDASDTAFPGRAAYLREQLAALRVHVASLQETRASADATITSRSHVRFCAARDVGGNYGTELWFSRELPYCSAGTASCFFHPADFLVLHASPRLLIVRFSRAGATILFVSLHAPTAGSTGRNDWWRDLRHRLARLHNHSQVVLLGDFNVGFEAAVPARVGDLVWPAKQPVPPDLLGLLHERDLWVPSTFSACHIGQSDTWISPSGQSGSRLDYGAIPVAWRVAPDSTYVLTDLDWGQGRVDHFGLALSGRLRTHP